MSLIGKLRVRNLVELQGNDDFPEEAVQAVHSRCDEELSHPSEGIESHKDKKFNKVAVILDSDSDFEPPQSQPQLNLSSHVKAKPATTIKKEKTIGSSNLNEVQGGSRKRVPSKSATTSKKTKLKKEEENILKSPRKLLKTTSKSKCLSGQKRINDYFQSCVKSFQLEPIASSCSSEKLKMHSNDKKNSRKRLFNGNLPQPTVNVTEVIDLCLGDDESNDHKHDPSFVPEDSSKENKEKMLKRKPVKRKNNKGTKKANPKTQIPGKKPTSDTKESKRDETEATVSPGALAEDALKDYSQAKTRRRNSYKPAEEVLIESTGPERITNAEKEKPQDMQMSTQVAKKECVRVLRKRTVNRFYANSSGTSSAEDKSQNALSSKTPRSFSKKQNKSENNNEASVLEGESQHDVSRTPPNCSTKRPPSASVNDVDRKEIAQTDVRVLRRKKVEQFYLKSGSESNAETEVRSVRNRSGKQLKNTAERRDSNKNLGISTDTKSERRSSKRLSDGKLKNTNLSCASDVQLATKDSRVNEADAEKTIDDRDLEKSTSVSTKHRTKEYSCDVAKSKSTPSTTVHSNDMTSVIYYYDLTCDNDDNVGNDDVKTIAYASSTGKENKVKQNKNEQAKKKVKRGKKPKPPCPDYKVIDGTNFAVDAFRFGEIAGVTHYFLTHYHADHYIGLTRKFAMPLYMSPITSRLVRTFIPVDEKFIHEIDLHKPVSIDGIEVTAIDANHCPGAIMLIFKLPNGRCILHTGDFRANFEMESEPVFWNNDIHKVYLDTTYMPSKYAFCTQSESCYVAREYIKEFQEENFDCRILYICGAYLIGKEKFWSYLAHEFEFKVWTEPKRRSALMAMQIEEYTNLLTDDPYKAQMHVLSLNLLNYRSLVEYLKQLGSHFDVICALRPSGWEKNSRPQKSGKINILGIQYSEHSAHHELERFIMYLKPTEVVSTVPCSHTTTTTPKIPQKWYKYSRLSELKRSFQPSITSYIKVGSNLQQHAHECDNLKENMDRTKETYNAQDDDSKKSILEVSNIINNNSKAPAEEPTLNTSAAVTASAAVTTSTPVKRTQTSANVKLADDVEDYDYADWLS